ncbi:hypothetical protein EBB06_14300 [Crenobacter cavernae]|uniref:Uncharacterized protein n=1 Tax=Crenobacter cavernae TaxID=2290923 RepID=A0ABY0FDS7_9NEIS|nr:hypothetical protein EBB06_14300 [Crenobacter cavernae]
MPAVPGDETFDAGNKTFPMTCQFGDRVLDSSLFDAQEVIDRIDGNVKVHRHVIKFCVNHDLMVPVWSRVYQLKHSRLLLQIPVISIVPPVSVDPLPAAPAVEPYRRSR